MLTETPSKNNSAPSLKSMQSVNFLTMLIDTITEKYKWGSTPRDETHTRLMPFIQDYPGEPVPER